MPATDAPDPRFTPALAEFLERFPLPARHTLSGYVPDMNPEARAYAGCGFALTDETGHRTRVAFRSAKTTPAKAGLFVTLWKRDGAGVTRPYTAEDGVDEFWVAARTAHGYGYFAFPAAALTDAGVLASDQKPGKRGFRLYTPWDRDLNPGASKAWAWQRKHFTGFEG